MMEPKQVRRPTIYDVAAAAGVSKSLVSLVLKGSPHVTPARRSAVLAAIADLQYTPSRAASSLAGSRTRTIGVLLDDYRNLWFVELLAGMQSALEPLGFRVAVENHFLNAHVDPSPLSGFVSLRVDGIVVAMEPTEAMLVATGIPTVVAGTRELDLPGADVVANDDRRGGVLAAQHLLGLGHHRIAHLSGGGGAARERALGYETAMRLAGLTPRTYRGQGGTTEADGYQAAAAALNEDPELSAIFAANDTMALGAAAAARERNFRIPADLSLMGYDDSPLAASHLLQLTTVNDRSREVGREVAGSLLSRMADLDQPSRTTLVMPTLTVRTSTGPAGTSGLVRSGP